MDFFPLQRQGDTSKTEGLPLPPLSPLPLGLHLLLFSSPFSRPSSFSPNEFTPVLSQALGEVLGGQR